MDTRHASTVRVADRAAMIVGPSGAGKSALALQLIALGATLVADDRTQVSRQGDVVIADVPESIAGMIEARGVGILGMPHAGPTQVSLVVDLSRQEQERLPAVRTYQILGCEIPCLHRVDAPHFASAILLYLRCSISSAP